MAAIFEEAERARGNGCARAADARSIDFTRRIVFRFAFRFAFRFVLPFRFALRQAFRRSPEPLPLTLPPEPPTMNGVNSQFGGLVGDLAPARASPASDIKVWSFQLSRGLDGLNALRADWQAWLDELPGSTYLQSPAWIRSYLTTLAEQPDDVHFIAARRAGRLEAVFVLEETSHRLAGLTLRAGRLITGDHMHLSDVAIAGHADALWTAFNAWFKAQRHLRWPLIMARGVSADASLARLLSSGKVRSRTITRPHPPTLWLDCGQDSAHALRNVSRSHTTNVKRLLRRAREQGPLSYEVVTDPAQLDAALQAFFEVEGSGWKVAEGSAIRLHDALVAFYRGLSLEFGPQGRCRINLLRLNGHVIAAQFGLVSNRQLNLLKIGYAPIHAALAPGHLIMQHTIESVCADPALNRLSFVTNPPWAQLWKPEATAVHYHLMFRDSMLGRSMHRALRAGMSLRQRLGKQALASKA